MALTPMLSRQPGRYGLLLITVFVTVGLEAAESTNEPVAARPLPTPVRTVMSRRNLPEDSLSLLVHNLDTDEQVIALNPEVPRNPASVMKLVTTLVALDVLGPAYQWRTEAWVRGQLDGDTLDGDLLLKGYGDPFLVTERVWMMLRGMRLEGLRRIGGNLLLDDSFFDLGAYDPGAFDRQPLRSYNVEPNALMMNFKVVRYYFEPDTGSSAVNIRVDPELNNLKLINRLSVRNGRCSGYQRGIAINANDDYDEFTFSGQFPSGCERYAMTRAALSHNEFTFGMFRSMWREVGGEFDGDWQNIAFEPPENEKPFYVFESWPLADVISRVNKYSNNVMARALLLTVAAETYGAPGSEDAGRRAVAEWTAERGLQDPSLELSNGAGLSRTARITASQLAQMLRYAWSRSYMPEFLSSMSLTGLDGTTSRRFEADDPLAGRAHLKTGSLDDVSAIAGYVQARSGDRYVVVTLQNYNDVHRGYGEEVQEALLRWVYAR